MNRLVLALGIATVIFAGTTVYFARELHRERASRAEDAREPTPAAVTNAAAVPDRRDEPQRPSGLSDERW